MSADVTSGVFPGSPLASDGEPDTAKVGVLVGLASPGSSYHVDWLQRFYAACEATGRSSLLRMDTQVRLFVLWESTLWSVWLGSSLPFADFHTFAERGPANGSIVLSE